MIGAPDRTNQLDALFFGELFVAGLISGLIVKYGW
jgi:hypothetical protein